MIKCMLCKKRLFCGTPSDELVSHADFLGITLDIWFNCPFCGRKTRALIYSGE